ncbi:MAG: aminopeptidase P family protein [Clostridia bacterium]|nr:aminopeptidase P family protein [Clostridia bacterium]
MTASEKLIDHLHLGSQSAAVIHDPSNIFYLTEGYSGEGLVYISAKKRVIITDFRYTEQAEKQAPDFRTVMTDKDNPHNRRLAELCREDGITELRFESNYLSVDTFESLRTAVGEEVSYVPLKYAPQALRQIKTPAETVTMRKAAQITSEAFDAILGKIRPGMTEKELQIELDFTMYRLGAEALAFDTIIASGENGSLCHAIPGQRRLEKGDMITMDFGAKVGGYCSDMTRTVALGQPSPEMLKVYNTVLRAQTMCKAALAAGKNCFDIDKLARDYIDSQGYAGRFGHGLGHCVGIDIHEDPRLSPSCHETLKAGMVITVEPGVYIPGLGGVRIEDTCLVKENGCESLTTAPRELVIL